MGIRSNKHKKRKKLAAKQSAILKNIEAWAKRVIDPKAYKNPQELVESEGIRISARLQNPGQGGAKKILDTYAEPPPNGYYVIIGCGAAAMVNHTTLRQSDKGEKRIGDLPVMHIGLPDPWLHYHEHGMGQPPWLLGLPGYHAPVRPDQDLFDHSCSSQVFAKSTDAEWQILQETFEHVYRVEGWVAAIESRAKLIDGDPNGTLVKTLVGMGVDQGALTNLLKIPFRDTEPPDPHYRLLVILPDPQQGNYRANTVHFVYAHKIDICTGGGRLRIKSRVGVQSGRLDHDLDEPFKSARTPPWLPSTKWTDEVKNRRVIEGMDGLTRQTPCSDRICVVGSGGIGLNQMERAVHEGSCLDWVASNYMYENATFALRRNDTVLKPIDRLGDVDRDKLYMAPGGADALRVAVREKERDAKNTEADTFSVVPGSKKMRIGQHSTMNMDHVALSDGKVTVGFQQTANVQNGMVDFFNQQTSLDNNLFPFSAQFRTSHDGCCNQSRYDKCKLFDRLVLCLGQDQALTGEPINIAGKFTFTPVDHAGRAVALASTADGCKAAGDIRILGAAAAMFARARINAIGEFYKVMDNYRSTLPVSAVPPGFILNCCNIAIANGFFDDTPNKNNKNKNANTASQAELVTLLSPEFGGQAEALAPAVVTARTSPNDGFDDMTTLTDRLELANTNASSIWGADWKARLGQVLVTTYRDADDWTPQEE